MVILSPLGSDLVVQMKLRGGCAPMGHGDLHRAKLVRRSGSTVLTANSARAQRRVSRPGDVEAKEMILACQ